MSPAGQALQERFDRICRSELERLRKKTAALSADERARVAALALEVTAGLAVRLDAAIESPGAAGIAPAVMRLFDVMAPLHEEKHR